MISRWIENKELLEAYKGMKEKRKISNKAPMYPELEDKLFTWIINKRVKDKACVNIDDLRNQTIRLMKLESDPEKYLNFKISNGWICNFLSRHHLSSRVSTHRAQENLKAVNEKASVIYNYLQKLNKIKNEYKTGIKFYKLCRSFSKIFII